MVAQAQRARRRLRRRAGVALPPPWLPHLMRHAAAAGSWLAVARSVHEVACLPGHASANTTSPIEARALEGAAPRVRQRLN
jgi:integrase